MLRTLRILVLILLVFTIVATGCKKSDSANNAPTTATTVDANATAQPAVSPEETATAPPVGLKSPEPVGTSGELFKAIEKNNFDDVKKVCTDNPPAELINSKDQYGGTPLHSAISSNNKQIVEFLLSKGANVNALDDMNMTPLMIAVTNNYKSLVSLLIEKGADVNIADKFDMTPLKKAEAQFSADPTYGKEVINLLKAKGAK